MKVDEGGNASYTRTVDGRPAFEEPSLDTRIKMLSNMIEPATINSAPGVLKVPEMDVADMPFDKLQKMAGKTGKQMIRFFKGQGAIPSKQALKIYRELATRMLTGTKGAYQRLTEAARQLHTDRIEMIDEALKILKNK